MVQLMSKFTKTCAMHRTLRNFQDSLRVGLMQHEEYTARERLLMS